MTQRFRTRSRHVPALDQLPRSSTGTGSLSKRLARSIGKTRPVLTFNAEVGRAPV